MITISPRFWPTNLENSMVGPKHCKSSHRNKFMGSLSCELMTHLLYEGHLWWWGLRYAIQNPNHDPDHIFSCTMILIESNPRNIPRRSPT
jgi:hypothetical protein